MGHEEEMMHYKLLLFNHESLENPYSFPTKFRLEGRFPMPCSTLDWALHFKDCNRQVGYSYFAPGKCKDEIKISTVFIGLCSNFFGRIPLVFETLATGGVFGSEHMERYATYTQAEEGHQKLYDEALDWLKRKKGYKLKPMLAATVESLDQLEFPCYCTHKLDGIRCLTYHGQAVSRSLKPIPNNYVREMLSELPDGLDGELILADVDGFNEVQSGIMRIEGKPNFIYAVFDTWDWGGRNYLARVKHIKEENWPDFVLPILPTTVNNVEELKTYEEKCLKDGAEGVIIRNDGPYKFGRSTINQGWLLKWKRFMDGEAEILSFFEQITNLNKKKTNLLGRSERSSKKAGLVPVGTLGALGVRDLKTGVEFKIGTGFDADTRDEVWQNQEKYAKCIVKYQAQPHGSKNKPRFPSFLGFRHPEDM